MAENKPEKFNRYAEVFGGAMWFYVRDKFLPEVAYYNDIDPIMVNLFSCFKYYDEFIKRIENLPTYDKDTFQKMKIIIQDNALKSKIEEPNFDLAVAHVYLVTHIFSGFTKDIWRPNLNMVKRRPSAPDYMKDHAIVKRLKNPIIRRKFDILEVSNESYENFIKRVDNEDLFLYVDPPYWKTEGHYRHGEFNAKDHKNLIDILKKSKCSWMISYYDFPELRKWLKNFDYVCKKRSYMKASGNVKKGTNKNPDVEILIMNYRRDKENLNLFFK